MVTKFSNLRMIITFAFSVHIFGSLVESARLRSILVHIRTKPKVRVSLAFFFSRYYLFG